MPVLVTPERTVYRLADKAALASYVDTRTAAGHRVDYQLKANLAQLLGFDSVGKDRTKRWEAVDGARGKFYNLSDVSWFYHREVRVAVPLFGKAADKLRQMKEQHGLTDGKDVFKQVMEGKRTSREGWSCGLPPSALATLSDGDSIIGLAAQRAADWLNLDYGATVLPQLHGEQQMDSSEVERVGRSISATTGSLEVSLGAFLAFSARPTRWHFKLRRDTMSWRRDITFRPRALILRADGLLELRGVNFTMEPADPLPYKPRSSGRRAALVAVPLPKRVKLSPELDHEHRSRCW